MSKRSVLEYSDEDFESYNDGKFLFPDDATRLEEVLTKNVADYGSRLKLLRYYSQRTEDLDAKERWFVHIQWMLREKPFAWITHNIASHPATTEADYLVLQKQFDLIIREKQSDFSLRGLAGQFFWCGAPFIAETYLLDAEVLEPKNPDWSNYLSLTYMNMADQGLGPVYVQKAIDAGERALRKQKHPGERNGLFTRLSNFSFVHKDYIASRILTRRLLQQSIARQLPWSQHSALTLLGRIAIKLGNIKDAEKYLVRSGQLEQFTPRASLANELLDLGKKESVVCYLNLVGKNLPEYLVQIQSLLERLHQDENFRLEIKREDDYRFLRL